jgi:phosphatidylglycerol:prolipoprotein diacylglycerol transferase
MRPILFRIPGLGWPLFGFGVLMLVAFFAAMTLADRKAKRIGLPDDLIESLAVWMIIGGLVGARLFYVIQYWKTGEFRSFGDLFTIWRGGIVLYGSIAGGVIAVLLYRLRRPFPVLVTVDVLSPALALGMGIGRIGCFLNGCCYGDPCQLPWAVRFPVGSNPWWHQLRAGAFGDYHPTEATLDGIRRNLIPPDVPAALPIHPTQLYAALDGVLLCLLLLAFFPLRKRDGETTALLMITYPISRILIEQLRSDESIFFAGMTISQTISLAILFCGILFWVWLRSRPTGRWEDQHAIAPTSLPASA